MWWNRQKHDWAFDMILIYCNDYYLFAKVNVIDDWILTDEAITFLMNYISIDN